MDKPKLRHLDAFPIEISQKRMIVLHDPLRYGNDLVVSPALIELLRFFNGQNRVSDIQMKLFMMTGEKLELDFIEGIIAKLDENLLLDNKHFHFTREGIDQQFCQQKVRPAAHSGVCYVTDKQELKVQIKEFFLQGAGQPQASSAKRDNLSAIIAPHIDLRVAGDCYSWAYRELVEAIPANATVIILGTSHYGSGGLFAISEKDFDTPLGKLTADSDFIAALRKELVDAPPRTLTKDDTAHRLEHSIEFQTIFLRALLENERLPKIVPILVTSFQPLIQKYSSPFESPHFKAFTAALQRVTSSWKTPIFYVIGADLSHIGLKFGDSFEAQTKLPEIESADLAMLQYITERDTEGFYQFIRAEQDSRRVCGFPPILTFLAAEQPNKAQLLKYQQWSETATGSAVTFASVAFYK